MYDRLKRFCRLAREYLDGENPFVLHETLHVNEGPSYPEFPEMIRLLNVDHGSEPIGDSEADREEER